MSFSAHRPGRLGSQGRIEFDTDGSETEPLEFTRTFEPDATGSTPAPEPDPEAETAVMPETTRAESDGLDTALLASLRRRREASDAMPTERIEPGPAPDEPAPRESEADVAPRAPRRPWRRLAILGGAEGDVLDDVPTETSRFVQMFFVLAGTALVSAISMLFALTTGVRVAVWLAIPLAIIWSLIIFNLDRFLTTTMKATRNVWKLVGLAVPRVIMAAIIGVVVAEPLVLQIFHNDVSREVSTTNLAQSQKDQKALDTGPEKKALDAASKRVADLENQAATGIVTGTSSQSATEKAAQGTVDTLDKQLAAQQKVIDKARAIYQCELTGVGAGTVEGCTGVSGDGASSDAAKKQLAQAQQNYDALAAKLKTAQTQLNTAANAGKDAASASEATNRKQANDQLPTARKTYDTALAAYNARAEGVATGNADAVGLLSQITALNSLSEKEPTLGWAHWLIAALFFMIELLPVLVKVMVSYGDKSLYEEAEDVRKQVTKDRITAQGWRERAAIASGASPS